MSKNHHKRTSGLGSFIIYFVAAAFVLFVMVQGYNALFKKVPTETAVIGSATESFSTQGVVFRDEILVCSDETGILDYNVDEGEKIAKGAVIASYYESQEDIDNKKKIAVLEDELKSYTDVISSTTSGGGDIKANTIVIGKTVQQAVDHNLTGDYRSASNLENELKMLIHRGRYISGEVTNFDAEIAEIMAELEQLGMQQGSATNEIISPRGGYFSKNIDGYEDRINTFTMPYYDVPALRDLMVLPPDEISQNAIGKVAASFEFYYLTILDKATADLLYEGKRVNIRFDGMEDTIFPATVSEIGSFYDGECVVKFKSTYTAHGLALNRMQKAEVITNEYSGIKIPKSAVRVIDGQEGVFVLVGSIAKFRTIETQHLFGDYYIAKQDNTSKKALLVGDSIIVNSTDVYDGKVMK